MKSFLKTVSRAVAALFAVALVTMGVASPAFADGAAGTITNARTGEIYSDLATATEKAESGDTIKLGEGNYTLYGVSSVGHTKGKDLTFEGLGTDKTAWNIGAEVPDPANYGTEYNGDYSFDGAGTVTFKNMKLRSGSADYLGFIRADKTVVDSCIVNGKTFYWGYSSAEFRNTTFNAPNGDYAIWTYSSPTMTFDSCTFNASGKVINVYTDAGAGSHDITVNVNNCTFNSATSLLAHKQALNINDSNMGDFKYILNITGTNTVNFTGNYAKNARDITTCSQLFGFGGKSGNDTGRTDVYIGGTLVWSKKEGETFKGEMKTHSYTDGEHDNAYDVTYTEWASDNAGTWTRTGTPKCKYCGFVKPDFVEKAYDLSYDLNGSEDKQTVDFATVEHVTEAEVTAEQPVRKGYSFVGWNTAKDGSGTSYAAGDKVELSAPVTLYAQWKKDEPAPKPSDNKPSDNKPAGKPANKTKANKQDLPNTGDASANIVAAIGIMAIACFVASAVVSKVRK
ncbi:InlB B-repeat-containing protein [Collinsella sp. LCP19S3_F2]|uniref:InlB B-repeat-containing protein n=1 Tax=Collinsella sp. LCP19S3_F2 TaxID=3438765 RepID=UPI003F8F0627